MARNYEPLVQVSFRTSRKRKEIMEIMAKQNGQSLSEYLDQLLSKTETLMEEISKKKEEIKKRDEIINVLKKMLTDKKKR